MKPVLLWLGDYPIRGYGAFVGAALVISMTLVMRYGRRIGLRQDYLLDSAFASVIGGLIGARLMYVLVHAGDFTGDPFAVLRVWEGGMMYFGGLVLGIVSGTVVAIRKGLPIWSAVDCVAPAMGAGQAIGRVACLVAACCYGPPHAGEWGIVFTDPYASAPLGVPLLPVQIFQIIEGMVLWAFGSWLFKHRTFDGQAFLGTLALAGFSRIVMEGFRGDDARGFFLQPVFGETISSSRAVGVGLIVVSLGLMIWRGWYVRSRRAAALPGAVV